MGVFAHYPADHTDAPILPLGFGALLHTHDDVGVLRKVPPIRHQWNDIGPANTQTRRVLLPQRSSCGP